MKANCSIIQLPLDALSPSPQKHPQRLTKTTIQDPRYGNVLWVFFCSETSGNWRKIVFTIRNGAEMKRFGQRPMEESCPKFVGCSGGFRWEDDRAFKDNSY